MGSSVTYINEPQKFIELFSDPNNLGTAKELIDNQLTRTEVRALLTKVEEQGISGFDRQLFDLVEKHKQPEITRLITRFYSLSNKTIPAEQFQDGRIFKDETLHLYLMRMIQNKQFSLLSEIMLRIDHKKLLAVLKTVVTVLNTKTFPLEDKPENNRFLKILEERLRQELRTDLTLMKDYSLVMRKIHCQNHDTLLYFAINQSQEDESTLPSTDKVQILVESVLFNISTNKKIECIPRIFSKLPRIDQIMFLGSINDTHQNQYIDKQARLYILELLFTDYFPFTSKTSFEILEKFDFSQADLPPNPNIFSRIVRMEYFEALPPILKTLKLEQQLKILCSLNEKAWATIDEFDKRSTPVLKTLLELMAKQDYPEKGSSKTFENLCKIFELYAQRVGLTDSSLAAFYEKHHQNLKANQELRPLLDHFLEAWRGEIIEQDKKNTKKQWISPLLNKLPQLGRDLAESFNTERLRLNLSHLKSWNLIYLLSAMSKEVQETVILNYLELKGLNIAGEVLFNLLNLPDSKILVSSYLCTHPELFIILMKHNIDAAVQLFFEVGSAGQGPLYTYDKNNNLIYLLIDLLAFGYGSKFSKKELNQIPKASTHYKIKKVKKDLYIDFPHYSHNEGAWMSSYVIYFSNPTDTDYHLALIDTHMYFRSQAANLLEPLLSQNQPTLHWNHNLIDRFIGLACYATPQINQLILRLTSKSNRETLRKATLHSVQQNEITQKYLPYWTSTDDLYALLNSDDPLPLHPPIDIPLVAKAPPYVEHEHEIAQPDELSKLREENAKLKSTVEKQLTFIRNFCIARALENKEGPAYSKFRHKL